jgi:hypothetical protein
VGGAGLSGSSRVNVVPGSFPFLNFSRDSVEQQQERRNAASSVAIISDCFQLRQAFLRIFVEQRLIKSDA